MSFHYSRAGIRLAALFFACSLFLPAQVGDAEYGKELLASQGCTGCHSVAGAGEGTATDLGRHTGEQSSPAAIAARMWIHGPAMFQAMKEKSVRVPFLNEVAVANLYAYLYSIRYFDPPGDAGRGETVFNSKHCSQCHAITAAGPDSLKPGPPVTAWLSLADRVVWLEQMWNHGPGMNDEIKRQGLTWPQFTLQEMVDLLTYLENHPDVGLVNPGLQMGDWDAGRDAFQAQGCAACHTIGEPSAGKVDLLAAAQEHPQLTGLAVEMWNHQPQMLAAAAERGIELQPMEQDEMPDLLAYLFRVGYFSTRGDAQRGAQAFKQKSCARCHEEGAAEAPKLVGGDVPYTETRMAAAVWQHGPEMKAAMDYLEIEWPALTTQDVLDLIAYLNQN